MLGSDKAGSPDIFLPMLAFIIQLANVLYDIDMTAIHQVRDAWTRAEGAFLDGRLDTLAYKHKQIYGLFDTLQQEGKQHDFSEHELEETLESISRLINSLPRNLTAHFERRQDLSDLVGSKRSSPAGPVVIVQNESFPLTSWAIPLSQAMADGNTALVLLSSNLPNPPNFPASSLDRDAFAFLSLRPEDIQSAIDELPRKAGLVSTGLSSAPGKRSFRHRHIPLGSTPVIVDQSILPNGRPLLPDEEAKGIVPRSVHQAAQKTAAAWCINPHSASLGYPAYILVHENVVRPFVRALRNLLPAELKIEEKALIENRQSAESLLTSLRGRLPIGFIPIYTTRSIDSAIDFLQSQNELPRQIYVLASRSFGAYVANSLKQVELISINDFSPDVLALGPYTDRASFSFILATTILAGPRPLVRLQRNYASIKPWRLRQDSGKRIDFFGGSFMFAAGVTLSTILGFTGYAMFKLGRWAWVKFLI